MSDVIRDRIREGRPTYFNGERVESVERYDALLAGEADTGDESLDDLLNPEGRPSLESEPAAAVEGEDLQ